MRGGGLSNGKKGLYGLKKELGAEIRKVSARKEWQIDSYAMTTIFTKVLRYQ